MNVNRITLFGFAALLVCCLAPLALAEPPLLFDGKTLDNWTTESGDPVPAVWRVEDGVIHLNRGEEKGGHIITKDEYGDFILTFSWKIAEGGNSGLKYRVRKYDTKTLGIEYQILDDPNTKEGTTKPRNSAGTIYDLFEANEKKKLNPAGEWNDAKIVVQGNHIEHWLNSELIVSAEVGSPIWKERVAESKFKTNEGFGENRLGKIMLTDHGAEVWYKDLKLVPLPMAE